MVNMRCGIKKCKRSQKIRGFCIACYYRQLRNGTIRSGSQSKKWKHRLTKINVKKRTAVCAECGIVKIHKRGKSHWRCSVDVLLRCKQYKKKFLAERRASLRKACEICKSRKRLCWDHNHKTGKFRGTLCISCNFGIGIFNDSQRLLKKAANYVS